MSFIIYVVFIVPTEVSFISFCPPKLWFRSRFIYRIHILYVNVETFRYFLLNFWLYLTGPYDQTESLVNRELFDKFYWSTNPVIDT